MEYNKTELSEMERETVSLNVLDFSEYPGPRYNSQGPDSGERFYVEKLNPSFLECYLNDKLLLIDLDGTAGYASSFLDEAFGQLTYDFGSSLVLGILRFHSVDEPEWPDMILNETIPQWQNRRELGQQPLSTMPYCVDCLGKSGELEKRKADGTH